MKRILALLLCFALCLSLLPASFAEDIEIIDPEEHEETLPEEEIAVVEPADEPEASPIPDAEPTGEIIASGTCGANLTWTMDDEGTLTIFGTGDMFNFGYQGSPWNNIHDSIRSIVISEGVTSIGDNAFYSCNSLTSITIPDSVTSIGGGAFEECDSLTSITIPGSVTSMGRFAFSNCSNLKTAGPIGGGYNIEFGWQEGIPAYAFDSCYSMTSVTIPDSVTSIGRSSFYSCSSLTGVTIPDSVTSIGEYAFSSCSKLTSVTIGNGVTTIERCTFLNCRKLTSVTIGNGVTTIGESAFADCLTLPSVTIPEGVTSIRGYAFTGCIAMTSVTLPASMQIIETGAFSGSFEGSIYYNLTNVYYGGYEAAAEHCKGNGWSTSNNAPLFNATWTYAKTLEEGWDLCGNDLLWQYDSATRTVAIKGTGPMWDFNTSSQPWNEYASKLVGINFEPGVTRIGNSAFYNCSKLRQVTVPDSVTDIKSSAFSNCSSLTSVTFGNGLKKVEIAFQNCTALNAVYLTDLAAWCGIEFLGFEANPLYHAHDLYLNGELVTDLVIPEVVTSIGQYSFIGCSCLTSVTIPDFVTSIGQFAFHNCSGLESVMIGNGLQIISASAFYNCSALTDVTIGSGVTSIGPEAFRACSSLESIRIPNGVENIGSLAFGWCYALSSVTIPDSVTYLDEDAFYCCSALPSVTIPASVNQIGNYAFGYCSALKSVTFLGGPPTISSNSFYNVTATCWYIDDGSWWEDDMEDYGGHLVWVPRGETLYLSDGSISVAVFDNRSLTLSRADGTAVYAEWSTSDANVARVDDRGQVEGIKYGKCTISASTGGQIYSCEVQTLFWDVADPSVYYFKHVYWAAENGITKGYDLEYFDPQGKCTREQMMTFLWRLAGQPNPTTTTSKFSDVKKGSYYYKAVLWGVEKGITNGYSSGPLAGKFGVGEACTREQAMTFLWRMAGKPDPTGTTNKFKDVKKSDYFYKAVLWASENKIANGYADGTYGVGKACLREHMVTFLSKYDAKFGNH